VRSIALIGPNARYGRVQGGGSARVRPVHRPGPLDALTSRGFEVTFEPGGSIARFLPTVHGEFTIELVDGEGVVARADTDRLSWREGDPLVDRGDTTAVDAGITGGFVPDVAGAWEFGVRAIGPVTLVVDGDVVIDVPAGRRGGAFYGLGGPEERATVELEAGRRCEVAVHYPATGEPARRVLVGARPVSTGGHIEHAAAAAADADVAVVVVGTDDNWETEGEDRSGMSLPGDQDELVAAVAAANPSTVVVVNSGSPVTMPWLGEVSTVLQLWFPGQELGDALADVLTGAEEPGGRLPVTFPVRIEDTPAYAHYPGTGGRADYAEGAFIGHRWYDREGIAPLFPFGHGLGYTTFSIRPTGLAGTTVDGAEVTVEVTNTGHRRGSEVVQVYVGPPPGDPARPLRHLAGFGRVDLEPGASAVVEIELDRRAFTVWDGQWTVPPGDYEILVGRSSRDLTTAGTIR
jgi:beta-glucosidase